MKRCVTILLAAVISGSGFSYGQTSITAGSGKCGKEISWTFDGVTLTLTNTSKTNLHAVMEDYSLEDKAPWIKKDYDIKKVRIGKNIGKIGSCAFANCTNLLDVEFDSQSLTEIGWGAFLNCIRLRNISLPSTVNRIETIAFAKCRSLLSATIPEKCRVEDQAYLSCSGISSLNIALTSVLGHMVFASEIKTDTGIKYAMCDAEIKRLPAYINALNCQHYGLAKSSVKQYYSATREETDLDENMSDVDNNIPFTYTNRNNTYALVIGNQDYRFVPDVPYAIHDARVFARYCNKTLGIPSENIHICENATKYMILEDEFEWIESIENRPYKQLIVYYAGHGVPDIHNRNKAYLLPADVRGTNPRNAISLDDFCSRLGDFAFAQTKVFLDACFSGVTRENESVNEGLRGVEIDAEGANVNNGNLIVFSAAQGNQTAQSYVEQGHGLFTYFLLKAIKDTGGMIYLGNLSENIISNVSRTAPNLRLRKSQTPSTNASESLGRIWESWTL